jgi:hypothetical protein
MDDQIVTREHMRERGREARAAGKGRDEHGMNPWVAAVAEWRAGWDEEDSRANGNVEQLEAA